MSAYDKNKIFFGLIHYILSEQHNVDWILKTSLVNFTGLNTTVSNKKFKQNSVTDDVIEYIYQIKPYHVQFEQFIEKHSSKDDIAKIDAQDTNNVTINVRFDAIQPYTDIDKTFYQYIPYIEDDETVDEDNLPKYKSGDKRNVEGLTIFSELHNCFYERHFDKTTQTWIWVQIDYELLSDKYYYATSTDSIYNVKTLNGVKILNELTKEEVFDFIDTHKANRIWYAKRNVFTTDSEMKEYITDVLNAHFKGISIDGSKFDFGEMGYDAFLYDEKLYDEPTISNIFCLVDFSEPISYKYTKTFVNVGIKTLLLESDDDVLEANCKIYYKDGNDSGMITTFSISDNMLLLPRPLKMYEKITVVNTVDNVMNAFVFVAHPFVENNNMDDTVFRKFVDVNTVEFEIPENNLGSRKVLVYIIYRNGSRKAITNFEELNGRIILPNKLEEDYQVQVTVLDYRRIYDKIYTWEDRYGNSNNNVLIDGSKFLRANYEAGRPSELAVSYPIDGSMIYSYNKEGQPNVYKIDWKNEQSKLSLSTSMQTYLVKDINLGDYTIEVEDATRIFKPTLSKTGKIIPAKILINSEIIEYHELEIDGNKGILKGIRRASSGSVLNETIPVEYTDDNGTHKTIVYGYEDQSASIFNPQSIYIATLFKEGMKNKFTIPSKFKNESKIVVYKKPHISLLTDINFDSKYFDISSNNVVLPSKKKIGHIARVDEDGVAYDYKQNPFGKLDNGNILNENDEVIATFDEYGYVYDLKKIEPGYLFINGDKIYFNSITETRGKYRIKNFNITKEYNTADAIILSDKYELLDSSEYEVVCNVDEDTREHMYIEGNIVYNPIDDSVFGICVNENGKRVVYYISNKDEKIGYISYPYVYDKNIPDKKIGRISPAWSNIAVDIDDWTKVLGYIKGNDVYEFNKIIGYINDKDEIVGDNNILVDYPYKISYKDAYVILNETPLPLECIIVGNEK